MTLESWIAVALRRRRCSSTSSTRCSGRRSSEHDMTQRLAANPLLLASRAARREAARHLPRARLRRLDALAARRSSAPIYRLVRRRRRRGSALDALRRRRCCSSASASMLLTYVVLRLQHVLPLNPQHLAGGAGPAGVRDGGVVHDEHELAVVRRRDDDVVLLADDAARVSQLRVGGGRAWRSPSRSCAASRASRAGRLGNFWVDLVRGTLYVLLPLSLVLALLFVQQGVIQNFKPYLDVTTLEGAKQTIAMGPVASQEAIKQLGTNGGGFFNANAAHPFENPTPWTNFWSMFTIFVIPSALTYMLGRMVKNQKHGWAVWAAMFVLFFGGVTTAYWAEARGNPIHAARGVDVVATRDESRRQHGRARRCASASPTPRSTPR